MAISNGFFLAWLRAASERTVLVEVDAWSGGAVVTRYMSTRGWVSSGTDTPAHTAYDDLIIDVPGIRAQMADALEGRSVVSFGDIEIDNASGVRDSWLLDAWDGRPLRIYLGDASWPKSDFRLVFSGVTLDIQARGDASLVLRVRDRQLALDKPVLTSVVSGTGTTAGQRLPACYGQVFNVEPMLVDSATRKYQVHDGQIESIDALKSNGEVVNPANYTVDLSTGTFTTAFAITGQLTCDVKGSKTGGTYVSKTGDIFQRILIERAGLTTADIDTAAVTALNTAAPGVVGLYIRDDSASVMDALDTLITGAGGYYTVLRDGRFTAALFTAPTGSPALTLDEDDLDAIELTRRIVPVTAVRLGYGRNYTQSSSVSANVTDSATRARLADEWLIASATTGATNFLLATDTDVLPTCYFGSADAATEASRRAALYGVLRRVFTLHCTLVAQQIRLGDVVALNFTRYSLSGGVLARVVGMRESITTDTVELEVFL